LILGRIGRSNGRCRYQEEVEIHHTLIASERTAVVAGSVEMRSPTKNNEPKFVVNIWLKDFINYEFVLPLLK
jgi:hypothetical protein